MRKPVDMTKFASSVTKKMNVSYGFNDPEVWVSTGNYILNYLISGDFNKGVPLSKVTMFAGDSGCLPEDAVVNVRFFEKENKNRVTVSTNYTVKELNELYHSGEYDIELETPDGWQKVTEWFNKGPMKMVVVETENFQTSCAVNHLLQLENNEWKKAEDIMEGDVIQTITGNETVSKVEPKEDEENCYDFTIDHPNHRYYGDGLVSHNSGKSFIAAGKIVKNCQDRGIMPVIFDSENALDEQWLKDLGVDTDPEKLMRFQVSMINDVGKIMSEFMSMYQKEYMDLPKEERPCFMFVVDSLGMLLTETDIDQFEKGDMKGDMGRKPKQLNALVRNLVNQVADKNVGVVFTNHTYASQDIFDPDDKISGGCLVTNTSVLTDQGEKPIQDFEVGDRVLSSDGRYHDVIQTWHYQKETFEVGLEDGTKFECSPEHKFLVKNNDNEQVWKEVQIIYPNEVVHTLEGKTLSVKSVKKTNEIKDVYDVQVEDTGDYILKNNNVISHNSGQIFASSIVVASKKLKLKTDDNGDKTSEVNGIRAMVKIMKSRYGRAYETAKLNIRFDSGLEPYSGCLEYFEKLGVIEQVGNKLRYVDKDGNEYKEFRKKFEANHDLLQKIIDEWNYEKYRLISSEQVDNSAGLVHDQDVEQLEKNAEQLEKNAESNSESEESNSEDDAD